MKVKLASLMCMLDDARLERELEPVISDTSFCVGLLCHDFWQHLRVFPVVSFSRGGDE